LQISAKTGHHILMNPSAGSYGIKGVYAAEANPRWQIGIDQIGSGLSAYALNQGGGTSIAGNGVAFGVAAGRTLGLYTSNGTALAERLRINGSGNVGIGTTEPRSALDVNGTVTATEFSGSAGSLTETASIWRTVAGSPARASNTTFTMTGDQTALFAKGVVIKWTESATVRVAMVSIPSTYSSPNTTVTIVGDTMASIDASSLRYCMIGAEPFIARFAIAGSIGATATDAANAYYANEPMRVLGADMQTGTAGITNSTSVSLINGTGTVTLVSPTLGTTVAVTATPQAPASSALSLALNDRVSLNITAVQTTAAVDLYVQLYLFPTRYVNMN
jgi:hypothetical protein